MIILCTIKESTSWIESNWFASIVGAVLSFLFTCTIFWLTNKQTKKSEARNLIILIMTNYHQFISMIYNYSYNPSTINYAELRKSLFSNSNILLVLPKDIKKGFLELYKIHMGSSNYYDQNMNRIPNCLKNIVEKLDKIGVDIFGNK